MTITYEIASSRPMAATPTTATVVSSGSKWPTSYRSKSSSRTGSCSSSSGGGGGGVGEKRTVGNTLSRLTNRYNTIVYKKNDVTGTSASTAAAAAAAASNLNSGSQTISHLPRRYGIVSLPSPMLNERYRFSVFPSV